MNKLVSVCFLPEYPNKTYLFAWYGIVFDIYRCFHAYHMRWILFDWKFSWVVSYRATQPLICQCSFLGNLIQWRTQMYGRECESKWALCIVLCPLVRDSTHAIKIRQIKKGHQCTASFCSRQNVLSNKYLVCKTTDEIITRFFLAFYFVFCTENGHSFFLLLLLRSILSRQKKWGKHVNKNWINSSILITKEPLKNIKHEIGLIYWVQYVNFCYQAQHICQNGI